MSSSIRQQTQTARRARILLAEDDLDLRQLLSESLRCYFEVVEAKDGRELLHLLRHPETNRTSLRSFDLVITDFRMPGASGLDALAALAEIGQAARVILISAFIDDNLQHEAARLGAGLLLVKPLSTATLIQAATSLLAKLPPR